MTSQARPRWRSGCDPSSPHLFFHVIVLLVIVVWRGIILKQEYRMGGLRNLRPFDGASAEFGVDEALKITIENALGVA